MFVISKSSVLKLYGRREAVIYSFNQITVRSVKDQLATLVLEGVWFIRRCYLDYSKLRILINYY